jgi:IclR family KDG regulon transcriptional repressor
MFTRENGEQPSSNEGRSDRALVPAVAKAFRVLEALSESGEPLGVSELARRLSMGKSTVHGLLTTLDTLGIIDAANGGRRYRIGRGLHALASRSAGSIDLRTSARSRLESLAGTTGQTAFLGVPNRDTVTILDMAHGRPAMSVSAPVGSTIPLLAGAVGKTLLAAWPEPRRDAFLKGRELPRFTRRSLTDPQRYRAAVRRAAERGFAVDVDEYVDGIHAAAAAIVGSGGEPVGVLWVAGFARHMDDKALDEIAKSVALAAREIGALL